jgi:hypothetical protein
MTGSWAEPLLHGVAGLGAAAAFFLLAKVRFRAKGGAGASADSGLD